MAKESIEDHYYIMNFTEKNLFIILSRNHWLIENKMHWELDNIFFEDKSRWRKGNLSYIFNLMRKLSLLFLKLGIKIITENNYNIGTLGDILRMRTSLISKICLGKPFSMNEALSV